MPRLRHINRNKKLTKIARTIPIPGHKDYGDGEDDGKWYRCWNCGFVCNEERDELGGPSDRTRITSKAYTQSNQYGQSATAASPDWTIFQSKYTRYTPEIVSGCPFCGTLNWRGDNP